MNSVFYHILQKMSVTQYISNVCSNIYVYTKFKEYLKDLRTDPKNKQKIVRLVCLSLFILKCIHDAMKKHNISIGAGYDMNKDNNFLIRFKRYLFKIILSLPKVGTYIEHKQELELKKFKKDLIKDRFKHVHVYDKDSTLKNNPETIEHIKEKIDIVCKPNVNISQVSGSIYVNTEKIINEFSKVCDMKTLWLNPTHPDIWPNLIQMETELCNMCSELFNAKSSHCVLTYGGTMSNLEALYTYRNMYEELKNIKTPNIVAPITAHTSFRKACKILKIEYRVCDVNKETGKANVSAMEKLIDANTILLVASAPSFPYGIIDPINEISELCKKYDLPLHVDACLGGFELPFVSNNVYHDIGEIFDFRNNYITSISADLHKFGRAPKGVSILMFKNYSYKKYLTFVDMDWSGGIYVTPDFSGSRAGYLIVASWAILKMTGKNYFKSLTSKLISTKNKIISKISEEFKFEQIHILGEPKLSTFGLKSDIYNIHFIGDIMHKTYGWIFNSLPDGLHFCITENNLLDDNFTNKFITDLHKSIQYVMNHPDEEKNSSSYKIYCSTQSIPSYANDITEEIGRTYIGIQNLITNTNVNN
jgi:sphinganine-1-phosphate aldolase